MHKEPMPRREGWLHRNMKRMGRRKSTSSKPTLNHTNIMAATDPLQQINQSFDDVCFEDGSEDYDSRDEEDLSSNNMYETMNSSEMEIATATALATQAAAAAAAAAKAAAEVVRLASGQQSPLYYGVKKSTRTETSRRINLEIDEYAAVKIQAAFRGRLARKALKALKGLVKLQAMVRGNLVRRQARMALQCMNTLLRLQARIRERQAIVLDEHGHDITDGLRGHSSTAYSCNLEIEELSCSRPPLTRLKMPTLSRVPH